MPTAREGEGEQVKEGLFVRATVTRKKWITTGKGADWKLKMDHHSLKSGKGGDLDPEHDCNKVKRMVRPGEGGTIGT